MSTFSQTKQVTIPVDSDGSDKFHVGDFQRGSLIAVAAVTGDINFDVSNDGEEWDTLTAAAGTFNNITSPAVGKPRALPATLFSFRYARLNASANQATADGVVQLNLYAN